MTTKILTAGAARAAARSFVKDYIDGRRQWTIESLDKYLPRGWILGAAAEDGDFQPPTIENIARALRALAIRDPQAPAPAPVPVLFVAVHRSVMYGAEHVATAVSKTFAKRIANALNDHPVNREGV